MIAVSVTEMNVSTASSKLPQDATLSSSVVSLMDAVRHGRMLHDVMTPLSRSFSDEEKHEPHEIAGLEKKSISEPPKLPQMPKKSALRRHQSEPSNVTASRRAIFGNFFQPKPEQHLERRKRSASVSDLRFPKPELSCRDFNPPQGVSSILRNHVHFKRVDEVSLPPDEALPPLPSPLQRFYTDGKRATLHGMYPLVRPTPILRQSSYPNLTNAPPSPAVTRAKVDHHLSEVFNLTRSVRIMELSHIEDTSVTSGSSQRGKRISWDPRVTVTEFEDNVPRLWFTDGDLERFRVETVSLAQRYLIRHPEMIEVYNKPKLDPVTGTLRKKALFSMPALSNVSDDSSEESLSATIKMADLAARHVKRILVVDRNKLILDLFCRSLWNIFPTAEVVAVQTPDAALDHIKHARQSPSWSFDLVIAEERLHQPLIKPPTPAMKNEKSCGHLASLSVDKELDAPSIPRHGSLCNLTKCDQCRRLSGSELLHEIKEMSTASSAAEASSVSAALGSRPLLLIGVSAYPDKDSEHFYESGADLVWGKPPPTMNDQLRDQLVLLLMKKRRGQ